jgi:hypothetical protein
MRKTDSPTTWRDALRITEWFAVYMCAKIARGMDLRWAQPFAMLRWTELGKRIAMAASKAIDFTITLSKDDWDAVKGGWRCPALQIPGTCVQGIYVEGSAIDPKHYEVNHVLCLIRWGPDAHPKQASVHIHAEKALSTEELTIKWRKLAIILPVVGSILTAIITSIVAPLFKTSYVDLEGKSKTPILKIFDRSNDFLASGDAYQFPSLLKRAKREAWFVGTTFYITTDQYHDQLLSKLADGVDLNFLVLAPEGQAVSRVARLLGVAEKELVDNCMSGLRTLNRISSDARTAKVTGALRVKIVDEPLQTRLYLFDPRTPAGHSYYIPQLNGTNSQTLPGFLASNSDADYLSAYFTSVLKMWNDSEAKTLEDWKSSHPAFE